MKMLRSGLYCCAVLALLGAAVAAPVRVPPAEIDAENARWKAYGVTLPKGGVVLPEPYQPPYSNRSFIVPISWYQDFDKTVHATHEFPVKADALRADLPTLQFLMQKTYAGYSRGANRGWKWDAWFRSWNAQLARAGSGMLPPAKAFAPWDALQHVQYDGHSGILGVPLFASSSASAVLAARPAGACTALRMSDGRIRTLAAKDVGQQPHAVQAWDGARFGPAWYVSYPQLGETAKSVRCGGRDISVAPVPIASGLGGSSTYEALGDGIAYIRVPSFSDADDDALRKALQKAPGLGKEQVVLLDLRGNGGGVAPIDLLTTWFSGGAVEEAAAAPARIGSQSCFNTALQFNANSQSLSSVPNPAPPAIKQRIQQVLDSIATTAPDACDVKPDVNPAQGDGTAHQFSPQRASADQTRVIAIVDEKCAQDCEIAARILSRLPDTVLVGSSTFGALGFAEPGYFVLPYSRIAFRLASSRVDFYGDGRSVEGYGFTVDVLLPTAAAEQRSSLLALARALAR
jgi:Peptidase family S41